MFLSGKGLLIALTTVVLATGEALIWPVFPGKTQEAPDQTITQGISGTATTIVSAPYNPLALSPEHSYEIRDLEVLDAGRDRLIPLRIYLPQTLSQALPQTLNYRSDRPSAVPVILLSHGLGGSRTGLSYLATHWVNRGYAVVALQHLGSDDAVWRSVAPEQRYKALAAAASIENFLLRVKDIPAVLDQLEAWQADPQQDWAKGLDLSRIGMAGYSFGAMTAQAIGGQRFYGRPLFQDDRIQAVTLLSPSSPQKEDPQRAFRAVAIPWLLMTGTADVSSIGNLDLDSRLAVFPALPPGDKYEVVLQDAEHSAFGDSPLANDRYPRNPNHHQVILALSTAFWDTYLQHDPAAHAWLASEAPRSVLEANDRWQWN